MRVTLSAHVTATIGGRLSFAHGSGELLDDGANEAGEPTRNQLRVSPTAALSWQIADGLLLFAHAQSAFRPGLVEVTAAGSQRVERDSLSMAELGARFRQRGLDPIALSATLSVSGAGPISSPT